MHVIVKQNKNREYIVKFRQHGDLLVEKKLGINIKDAARWLSFYIDFARELGYIANIDLADLSDWQVKTFEKFGIK